MALNVALIGFGYVGRTMHAPLICSTPGMRLALVASSDAAAVAARLGRDVLVVADYAAACAHDGIDIVVIASPNER